MINRHREYYEIVRQDDQNYSSTTLTFKSIRDLFNLSTSSWSEVALVFSNSTESSNLFFTSSFPSTFCSKAVNLKAIIIIIYQSHTEGVKSVQEKMEEQKKENEKKLEDEKKLTETNSKSHQAELQGKIDVSFGTISSKILQV